MVPLGGSGVGGENTMIVSVSPSSLRDRIKIWTEELPIASVPWNLPPNSSDPVRVSGYSHGKTELIATIGSNGAEMSRMFVDVKQQRGTVKYALYHIRLTGSQTEYPERTFDEESGESFMTATWSRQANVLLNETPLTPSERDRTIAYDTVIADGKLESGKGLNSPDRHDEMLALINAVTPPPDTTPVFIVKEIRGVVAFEYAGAVFLQEGNRLPEFAQEVGHVLGVPESYDDEVDVSNVLSDPQVIQENPVGPRHIRRKDWNAANP
jgi:hypothetical protein